MSAARAEIENLRRRVTEVEKDRREEVAQRDRELRQRDIEIARLQQAAQHRSQQVTELQADLQQRGRRISELQQEAHHRGQQTQNLSEMIHNQQRQLQLRVPGLVRTAEWVALRDEIGRAWPGGPPPPPGGGGGARRSLRWLDGAVAPAGSGPYTPAVGDRVLVSHGRGLLVVEIQQPPPGGGLLVRLLSYWPIRIRLGLRAGERMERLGDIERAHVLFYDSPPNELCQFMDFLFEHVSEKTVGLLVQSVNGLVNIPWRTGGRGARHRDHMIFA